MSNWTGFSWSQLPTDSPLLTADFWQTHIQLLAWQHGYVIYGTTNDPPNAFVWTSADGQTWTQVTAIVAPQVLVAASPAGLVAVAGDPSATVPSDTVWTSSDGVQWHNAGTPSGLASMDSIAGTSAGLVATGHSLIGSGKFATQTFGVAFSTDGISWTPEEVEPGIIWDDVGPQVQSGNNRFFVMGGLSNGQASSAAYRLDALHVTAATGGRGLIGASTQGNGGVWWSDDGRTWARSTGVTDYGTALDVGRDGMLLYTSGRAIPGGVSLKLSANGGKTWQADDTFGPLGVAECGQGECSVGPDGVIGSNGTIFVAVKGNGKAWVSYDGHTWTTIAWNAPASIATRFLVLPRGLLAGPAYGAAK
jgi:hypothetical protein